jgi:hypothetical protein
MARRMLTPGETETTLARIERADAADLVVDEPTTKPLPAASDDAPAFTGSHWRLTYKIDEEVRSQIITFNADFRGT